MGCHQQSLFSSIILGSLYLFYFFVPPHLFTEDQCNYIINCWFTESVDQGTYFLSGTIITSAFLDDIFPQIRTLTNQEHETAWTKKAEPLGCVMIRPIDKTKIRSTQSYRLVKSIIWWRNSRGGNNLPRILSAACFYKETSARRTKKSYKET